MKCKPYVCSLNRLALEQGNWPSSPARQESVSRGWCPRYWLMQQRKALVAFRGIVFNLILFARMHLFLTYCATRNRKAQLKNRRFFCLNLPARLLIPHHLIQNTQSAVYLKFYRGF